MSDAPKTKLDYAAMYSDMHRNEKHFAGKVRGVEVITELVRRCQPRRLLDYGSGKGFQYLLERVHENWGGLLPYCYDIGVRQLARRPEGTFDGIICCDMMEHIDEADVDAVLEDISSFASNRPPGDRDYDPNSSLPMKLGPLMYSFVYFHISCIPSTHKDLPDGRNVHLTIKPPEWWRAKLRRFERPGLIVESQYETTPRR